MIEMDDKDPVKVISELVSAVNMMRLYPPDHPQISTFVDRLHSNITRRLDKESELILIIVDDDIIIDGKLLSNVGPIGSAFVTLMRKKGIERITLLSGLPKSQLVQFLGDLASSDGQAISARRYIKLGNILFSGLPEMVRSDTDGSSDKVSFHNIATTELKTLFSGINMHEMLDAIEAKNLAANFIRTFNQSGNPLKYLASIKFEDEYTYVHTVNVGLLTMSLADFLGFSGKDLVDITFAALMHDVGKMMIPYEILNKPGPLDHHERAIMETHTIRGAQYIGKQENMTNLAMLAALEHHIKFDGTGYPAIGDHWKTHIVSQMISVADIYDALRSRRPYREPVEHEEITAILRKGSGTALNPVLVENFILMITR